MVEDQFSKLHKISSADISSLFKMSDIIFIDHTNGTKFPPFTETVGIRSGRKLFSNEMFNSVLRKKHAYYVSISGIDALVTEEIFINFLSLVLERSARNGIYKQLPIKKYTKFERDLYDGILHQGAVSRKWLILLFGLSGKKSRKQLDDALVKLWERLWITRVGFQKEEGAVWQAVIDSDKASVRRALKVDKTKALEKIILAIVKGSKIITRPKIKRLLKGITRDEEADKVITGLLRKNILDVNPKVIMNGKRGLIYKE